MVVPSIHSERIGAPVYLGKRDARPPSSSHVRVADILKAIPSGVLPPIPNAFGYGLDFGATGWLMLGNGPDDTVFPGFQGAGDCFWAGQAHSLMESKKNAGAEVPPFSGITVVTQYGDYELAFGGAAYDPETGANDNGTDVQEGFEQIQKVGFYDDNKVVYHPVGQTIVADPGNLEQLWAIAYLLEEADVGVQFQQAQMDQFDNGEAWDYVAGSPGEGGHFVIVPGRQALISWAHRVPWTRAWFENLNDECYGHFDIDRYNTVTGDDIHGYNQIDTEKFMVLLAQQKAQQAA